MRVQNRWGSEGVPRSFRVQVGLAAVPLAVAKTSPKLCPTQITSELPGATAMALIKSFVFAWPAFMIDQAGEDGEPALTFVLRHSRRPPASIVLGLFGSRMNGAMKLAAVPASAMP